jgi:hypothetical protein
MIPDKGREFDAGEGVTRVGQLSCCGTAIHYSPAERVTVSVLRSDDVFESGGERFFVSFAHSELGVVAWPIREDSP